MRGYKEGGNSVVFFNKKRGHVMKVFMQNSAGDEYNGTSRTFRQTLSFALGQIRGRTFSQLEDEIKLNNERLERMKASKRNPDNFSPNPKSRIFELEKKVLELRNAQEKALTTFSSEKMQEFIPFVHSIRAPRIFNETRLPNGQYAVSMEYIRGPTLSELLDVADKKIESEAGKRALKFVHENKLDPRTITTKVSMISRALALASQGEGRIKFIPRLDSLIVEAVSGGNFKLVLVDNA